MSSRLVACRRPLAYAPQLAGDDLRLPLWIKGHGEYCPALLAEKLQHRDGSFRRLITRAQRFNDDIRCGTAFWALTSHQSLRFRRLGSSAYRRDQTMRLAARVV